MRAIDMLGAIEPRDTRPLDEYAQAVEAEFLAMKKAVEAAKWPADASAKVVAIDKEWQDAKATANAAKAPVVRLVPLDGDLRRRMREVVAGLTEKSGESFWGRPVLGPVPGWGVVAGGVGVSFALLALLRRAVG